MSTTEFVALWQRASCLADVAKAAGIKPLSCTIRAARLRRQGYTLEPFKRGPTLKIGCDYGDRRYRRWSKLTGA